MTTSNNGIVKIYFSETLVIPANATINIDKAVLNIALITQTSAYSKY
jgi:hypothetical protein